MAQTPDGGPEFPQSVSTTEGGGATCSYDFADGAGMTLRDYFAAHASADLVCDMLCPDDHKDESAEQHADRHAKAAYIYADAMLRARESK